MWSQCNVAVIKAIKCHEYNTIPPKKRDSSECAVWLCAMSVEPTLFGSPLLHGTARRTQQARSARLNPDCNHRRRSTVSL